MYKSDIASTEYASFYQDYMNVASDLSLLQGLEESMLKTKTFIEALPKDKLDYRYEVGKWTVKDIMQHIIDTEHIFVYRALRFAREDKTPLPGFEENDFAAVSNANSRTIEDLLEEYLALRKSTIALFKNFDEQMLLRKGVASDSEMSVRALGFIITGHEAHHCNVIKERYL